MAQALTFAERLAISRAAFQAQWDADHAEGKLIGDDPINPHKHYAVTTRGTTCMADRNGVCHIPHCTCGLGIPCKGTCYTTHK